MTKTEAASILADRARVIARQTGKPLDKDLVEAVMSEARHWHGLLPIAAATAPSWRTVLREATRWPL